MRAALAAVNLAVVLALPVHALAHGAARDAQTGPFYIEEAAGTLPPDQAQEVRDNLRQAEQENAPLRQKMGEVYRELHQIMVAPRFDRDAFLAKTAELRGLHDRLEANVADAVAASAADLSQAERVRLSGALHQERHKSWRHHHARPPRTGPAPGVAHEYPDTPTTPVKP